MIALTPVSVQLVSSAWAPRVVGPAYDALTADERIALAAANPDSFYNVVRSGPGPDRTSSQVLEEAADALERLLDGGRFLPRAPPRLYVYELTSPEHRQRAVVGDLPTDAARRGDVRPHERTRVAKEDQLSAHLLRLRLSSSPVGLTYRPSARIRDLVAGTTAAAPDLAFRSSDGVTHRVWTVSTDATRAYVDAFAGVGPAYIVDGHHRVAAALRVGDPQFFAALVPTDELRLLPYHRVVAGLGEDPADAAVRAGATEVPGRVEPSRGVAVVYAGGRWWRLALGREPLLDVELVDRDVLRAFGITDSRTDERLHFVPGLGGVEPAAARADALGGAAVLLAPPQVTELLGAVDAGRTLPPKSTWFEPKLHSGVFVVRR